MLLVPCEVRPSPLHGLGLFLLESVTKGTVVWLFDARVDRLYTLPELLALPLHVSKRLQDYGYMVDKALLLLPGDDGRFINHSSTPSCGESSTGVPYLRPAVALRDLAAGEEVTEDYQQSRYGGITFVPSRQR